MKTLTRISATAVTAAAVLCGGITTHADATSLQNHPAHAVAAHQASVVSPNAAGPSVPLLQFGTGLATEASDCGPTSELMALLKLNQTVIGYNGPSNHAQAIVNIRTDMGRPTGGAYLQDVVRSMSYFGVNPQLKDFNSIMSDVQNGKVAVLSGNETEPGWWETYPKDANVNAVIIHDIAVVDYNPSNGLYGVLDPDSYSSDNTEHWVTRAQLQTYSQAYTTVSGSTLVGVSAG